MKHVVALGLLLGMAAGPGTVRAAGDGGAHEPLAVEAVNGATVTDPKQPSRALLVRLGVLLDRAYVSPGVIDGLEGDNLNSAVKAYRSANGLSDEPVIDQTLMDRLDDHDPVPALVPYTVTREDAEGPWTRSIPAGMEQQARLERLGYRDVGEMLAERFHMDVDLLRNLNDGKDLDRPGQEIVVANVGTRPDPSRIGETTTGQRIDKDTASTRKRIVARIVVDKRSNSLSAFAGDGRRVLFGPVSIGSPDTPAPSGTLHVTRVATNPNYTYDPDYGFRGVHAKRAFTIAPGPNNPVGSVWIALDREGYGIHGTPAPAKIGKSQSHGCIRMTNWSALELASFVGKDVPVEFKE